MRGDFFVCPVCGNSDPKYIGYKNGKPYCRKCIFFARGKKAEKVIYHNKAYIHAKLDYDLTKTQEKASNEILEYVKNNKSVIVNAVCGSGKTELVYNSIEYFLNKNLNVAFTIPRKDVCIEIFQRLRNDYPKVKMSLVYGGNTNDLNGQLVVLTTHQLFRYENYFDLLILDEADAFPYYKNDLLNTFLKKAVKGPIIYLSATIKDDYLKECSNVVYVNRRFHNVNLPVPKIIKYNRFNKLEILNETIKKLKNKPILIFVPTIEVGNFLALKTNITFINSTSIDKTNIIYEFKSNKINKLITTSILERGMTFFNVQVIVFEADHTLFDESSLVQIAGRVGRKIKAPTGDVYFLSKTVSEDMKKCILQIENKNKESV